MFKKVLILGSGTIGASWATFYTLHGIDVRIYDINEKQREFGPHKAEVFFEALSGFDLAAAEKVAAAKERLHVAGSLGAMADGCDFVQESIVERLDTLYQTLITLPLFSLSPAATMTYNVVWLPMRSNIEKGDNFFVKGKQSLKDYL